jgi:hypothetical protein
MTEQPTETQACSEQNWLGNPDAYVYTDLQDLPRLHDRRNREHVAATTQLRPETVISATRPYEIAQANVLLRKSITAAGKLLNARAAAKKAEDAMSAALAIESLAEIESVEADRALLDFAREAAAE